MRAASSEDRWYVCLWKQVRSSTGICSQDEMRVRVSLSWFYLLKAGGLNMVYIRAQWFL